MSDVGRLAGVSHQTVSRVINGSRHVRPETRQRVLDAMRELDYRPNSVARALVTGRSNTLGVVTFDTTLYGPASTLFGIERAAHEAGYFIIVASLKALDHSSVSEAVERLRLHGVDGILVIAPQRGRGRRAAHAPAEIPLVAVEAGPAARSRWWPSTSGRAPRPRPGICSNSATAPSGTSPGRADWLEARSGSTAGARRSRRPAPTCPSRCTATGARSRATTSAAR